MNLMAVKRAAEVLPSPRPGLLYDAAGNPVAQPLRGRPRPPRRQATLAPYLPPPAKDLSPRTKKDGEASGWEKSETMEQYIRLQKP